MAGILFEDIFDVKDIDPEGKKFDRGEWGPGAARQPGPGCSLPGSSPGLRRLRPERLGAALPRRGGLLPSLSPACPAPPAALPAGGAPCPLAVVQHLPHRVLSHPGAPCFPSPASVPLHTPATPVRSIPHPTVFLSLPVRTFVCSRALASIPKPCVPLPHKQFGC